MFVCLFRCLREIEFGQKEEEELRVSGGWESFI